MRQSSLVLAFLISAFVTSTANAQVWACGQSMVETGQGTTKEEVLDKCGPPTTKDSDRWYYKNQPGQVTVVLTFETGKLMQIETIPE
jgi:hypothetical protein